VPAAAAVAVAAALMHRSVAALQQLFLCWIQQMPLTTGLKDLSAAQLAG